MALRVMRWLGIAALVIGYPLLAHYTNESAQNPNLGAVVAIAPVVLIGFLLAWHSPRRLVMMGVLVLVCVALSAIWSVLENHFDVIYWLQNIGMQLVLLMTFGRTLIAGRQPLCTRFAEALYGPVTPQHEIYTRQVTVAWTVFFAAMALASTLLFFLAPLAIWSIFSNFLTLPLVALMFIAEYWVRKLVLPDMQNMHILDAVRAFRNNSSNSSRTG
jgi:uncharacterized membrane protein